jgi:hypothetical protein
MMLKTLMTSLALTAALGVALPAYAQSTDQTDQSEEDWRKSRKKSGTSDIYRTPNTSSTGVGSPIIDYEPVSPVERLPSESRRHLMRERAKAIAESDDGDISDAEYVPSEEAKSDEQLMREEQEAWDAIAQGQADANGQSEGQGQSDSDSQGDASDQGDSSGGADSSAGDADARAEEPLSPLDRIRRSREESPARGTERSASDYLGTGNDD